MLRWLELGGAAVYPFEAAHLGDFVRWMRRYSEAHKREMVHIALRCPGSVLREVQSPPA